LNKIIIYSNSICFLGLYSKLITQNNIDNDTQEINLAKLKNLLHNCEFDLSDTFDLNEKNALLYIKKQGKTLKTNVKVCDVNKYHLIITNNNSDICKDLTLKTGVLHINSNFLYDNSECLFIDITIAVKKNKLENQFKGWDFLRNLVFPIDCILINDNHFMDSPELIEKNLFDLIKCAAENKSKRVFQTTIISNSTKGLLKKSVDKLTEFINKFDILKTNYELSAFNATRYKKHDREIFTNYLWIHSGHTLSIKNLNGEIKDDTTIRVVSIFSKTNSINYNSNNIITSDFFIVLKKQKLKDFEDIISPIENIKIGESNDYIVNFIGNKNNRIFKLP